MAGLCKACIQSHHAGGFNVHILLPDEEGNSANGRRPMCLIPLPWCAKAKCISSFVQEDIPGTGIGIRTSQDQLAVSDDGLHFTKMKEPVLYPDSSWMNRYDNPGGCEDPAHCGERRWYLCIIYQLEPGCGKTGVWLPRRLIALGKTGPCVSENAYNGKFLDTWSKSGSVVAKFKNNRVVAAK